MPKHTRAFGGPRTTKRKSGTRSARDRYLIVSGGKATEHEYLTYVRKQLGASGVKIVVSSTGLSPAGLYEYAIGLRDADRRDAKKNSDPTNVYKKVWIVTDVDDFAAEIQLLLSTQKTTGVDWTISNPCFEVFLVMHSQPCEKHLTSPQVQRMAKKLKLVTGTNDKNVVLDKIAGRFEDAEACAERMLLRHEDHGKYFPNDNPSTTMHQLIRTLIRSAEASQPGFSHLL